MTRINIGIKPSRLRDKHLLAEHREIVRIPNNIRNGISIIKNIPEEFTMGTGHVKFFYNKLLYLFKRYTELYQECLFRGFAVQNYESAWRGVPDNLMNDYTPTDKDIGLITQRLIEKDALIN